MWYMFNEINQTSEKLSFYPFKVFSYKPLITTIQQLCRRPKFIDTCDHWKQRNVHIGIIADVYDGEL